jgi:cell division protease FtsH
MKNLKNKNKLSKEKLPSFFTNFFSIVFVFLVLVLLYGEISKNHKNEEETSLSEVATLVNNGSLKKITIEGKEIKLEFNDGTFKKARKEDESSLTETLKNYGVESSILTKTPIVIKTESGFWFVILNLLPFLLPILIIGFLIWSLTRQVKGAGMQAFTFGQSKAKMTAPGDTKHKITFKDVAGSKEAKQELEEVVDFLKNPQKFLDIGARIPKGVLLTGAPGTGKTLLARAVAGEAGVPFFYLSGSEFVEMFVGVGASRVRDLFQTAKRTAPAIVFIDEIDAVGRVRGFGMGGGNDEREQTLNQILVEMDGFEPTEKVIVMAATNRSDVLDPALLRPGRFDRRVTLDLPDRKDREAILLVHANKKPLDKDVVLKVIAERTPGFSGADLHSLMNEGAILAARENRKIITQSDLIKSIEKVMLGPERKSHLMSVKEKEITAYHEAGHALISSVLEHADPVHKVTIVSRGRAGGYTLKLPIEEKRLQSKKEFLDDLAVSLGGYVAEETVFGDITTGPSNDLQVATSLARAMVTRWGMSENIGPIALESNGGQPLFGRGVEDKDYSEKMSAIIDEEVSRLMKNAFLVARDTIRDNRELLDAIAKKLVEVETLEQKEYEEIITSFGIKLKTHDIISPELQTLNK